MKFTTLTLTLTLTFALGATATPVVHNAPRGFPRVLDWRPFTLNPFVVLTEIGTVPALTDVIYFGDVVTSTATPTTLEKRVVGTAVLVPTPATTPATTAVAGNAATASSSGGGKQAETKKDTRPIKSYSGWNYRCVGPDC